MNHTGASGATLLESVLDAPVWFLSCEEFAQECQAGLYPFDVDRTIPLKTRCLQADGAAKTLRSQPLEEACKVDMPIAWMQEAATPIWLSYQPVVVFDVDMSDVAALPEPGCFQACL